MYTHHEFNCYATKFSIHHLIGTLGSVGATQIPFPSTLKGVPLYVATLFSSVYRSGWICSHTFFFGFSWSSGAPGREGKHVHSLSVACKHHAWPHNKQLLLILRQYLFNNTRHVIRGIAHICLLQHRSCSVKMHTEAPFTTTKLQSWPACSPLN